MTLCLVALSLPPLIEDNTFPILTTRWPGRWGTSSKESSSHQRTCNPGYFLNVDRSVIMPVSLCSAVCITKGIKQKFYQHPTAISKDNSVCINYIKNNPLCFCISLLLRKYALSDQDWKHLGDSYFVTRATLTILSISCTVWGIGTSWVAYESQGWKVIILKEWSKEFSWSIKTLRNQAQEFKRSLSHLLVIIFHPFLENTKLWIKGRDNPLSCNFYKIAWTLSS